MATYCATKTEVNALSDIPLSLKDAVTMRMEDAGKAGFRLETTAPLPKPEMVLSMRVQDGTHVDFGFFDISMLSLQRASVQVYLVASRVDSPPKESLDEDTARWLNEQRIQCLRRHICNLKGEKPQQLNSTSEQPKSVDAGQIVRCQVTAVTDLVDWKQLSPSCDIAITTMTSGSCPPSLESDLVSKLRELLHGILSVMYSSLYTQGKASQATLHATLSQITFRPIDLEEDAELLHDMAAHADRRSVPFE